MFGRSRVTIEDLQASVSKLVDGLHAPAPSDDKQIADLRERVAELELSRAKWAAEMEAALMKADGRYKAAAAAESRARTQQRAYEKIADEVAPDSPEGIDESGPDGFYDGYLPPGNDAAVPEGWVQPVPVGMEANSKTQAIRGKFS